MVMSSNWCWGELMLKASQPTQIAPCHTYSVVVFVEYWVLSCNSSTRIACSVYIKQKKNEVPFYCCAYSQSVCMQCSKVTRCFCVVICHISYKSITALWWNNVSWHNVPPCLVVVKHCVQYWCTYMYLYAATWYMLAGLGAWNFIITSCNTKPCTTSPCIISFCFAYFHSVLYIIIIIPCISSPSYPPHHHALYIICTPSSCPAYYHDDAFRNITMFYILSSYLAYFHHALYIMSCILSSCILSPCVTYCDHTLHIFISSCVQCPACYHNALNIFL